MRCWYHSHFIETKTEAQGVSTHSHIPGWCLGPVTGIVLQLGYSLGIEIFKTCSYGAREGTTALSLLEMQTLNHIPRPNESEPAF